MKYILKTHFLILLSIFFIGCVEQIEPIPEDLAQQDQSGSVNQPTPETPKPNVPIKEVIKLEITGIGYTSLTKNSVVISWQTNIPTTGQVEYGKNGSFIYFSNKDSVLKTSHQHLIENLTEDTTYSYRVKSEAQTTLISNGFIFKTLKSEIIGQAPIIIKQPISQTFNEGETSTITVEATGVKSYQWQVLKGDGFANPATNQTTKTLTLKTRPVDNGGTWRCVLVNDFGTTYTNSVVLNVKSTPVLKLLNIYADQVTTNSAMVHWELSDFATGQVEYWERDKGQEQAIKLLKTEMSFKFNKHSFKLENLKPNTVYNFIALSKDQNGTEVENHSPGMFTTNEPVVVPSPTPNPAPNNFSDSKRAFPNAFGGGAIANANHKGVLVIVDSLDYSKKLSHHPAKNGQDEYYTGGIDAAVESNIGPRYIVFNVSGIIRGNLKLVNGTNCWTCPMYAQGASGHTFFGQSAPRGGITITKSYLKYIKSNNIIVRYLTIRPGIAEGNPVKDDNSSTAIQIGGTNSIIDHNSVSWGGDKGIIAGDWEYGAPLQNLTISNNMAVENHTSIFIVDGINSGIKKDCKNNDWEQAGDISIFSNFIAGGNRTPNMGGFDGLGEIINNVVHSKGGKLSTVVYGYPKINHFGNYYKVAADSMGTPNRFQPIGTSDRTCRDSTKARLFSQKNYFETRKKVELDGSETDNKKIWISTADNSTLTSSYFSNTKHSGTIKYPYAPLSAESGKNKVLLDAGANKYLDDNGHPQRYQDDFDKKAIENFKNGNYPYRHYSSDQVLPNIPTNTRPASFDSDNDGMSDAWEMRTFGSLKESYRGDFDKDGVLNINEYMNQVDYMN